MTKENKRLLKQQAVRIAGLTAALEDIVKSEDVVRYTHDDTEGVLSSVINKAQAALDSRFPILDTSTVNVYRYRTKDQYAVTQDVGDDWVKVLYLQRPTWLKDGIAIRMMKTGHVDNPNLTLIEESVLSVIGMTSFGVAL